MNNNGLGNKGIDMGGIEGKVYSTLVKHILEMFSPTVICLAITVASWGLLLLPPHWLEWLCLLAFMESFRAIISIIAICATSLWAVWLILTCGFSLKEKFCSYKALGRLRTSQLDRLIELLYINKEQKLLLDPEAGTTWELVDYGFIQPAREIATLYVDGTASPTPYVPTEQLKKIAWFLRAIYERRCERQRQTNNCLSEKERTPGTTAT